MSLIRGLDRSPMKQKLLSSIVSLCQELGIQMIAEGIETEAERDTLVNLGGDLCQGLPVRAPAASPGPTRPSGPRGGIPTPTMVCSDGARDILHA